jgi:hypothetical protein
MLLTNRKKNARLFFNIKDKEAGDMQKKRSQVHLFVF